LLTGMYPHRHGVFMNDVPLVNPEPTLGELFKAGGYETAYIGKWHLDAHGRSRYIPRERRKGFDYWRVLECTHAYNDSKYYADDDPTQRCWEGYDATAQTDDACRFLETKRDRPFLLMLSWG